MSIPVICDRCRTVGFSGDSDFSHLGDLLEFTPVPRKKERVDGWTAERQRAFIAALSATGSKRRAAQAIGMAAYGVDQMLKSEGNESFKAAFDRAMAIAKANGSMKIAAGVADAAARNAQMAGPSALRGHAPEPDPEMSDEGKMELVAILGEKFMRKVAAERRARLAGEIVAADFYLRQVTFLEVMFDLSSVSLGFDANEFLRDLRRGDFHSRDIVSTPFSEWLDRSRRLWWAQEGEPDRPPHPDTRLLQRHGTSEGDCSTYADQNTTGATTTPARGFSAEQWAEMTSAEQKLARQAQFDADAEEQRLWERHAREAWAASEQEGGADA
jgi:hypothetical protein